LSISVRKWTMFHRSIFAALFVLTALVVHAQPPVTATRFQFKQPGARDFLFDTNMPAGVVTEITGKSPHDQYIRGRRLNDSENYVEASSRIIIEIKNARALPALLAESSAELSRTLAPNIFILQAPDPASAIRESERLAKSSDVISSSPVLRESFQKQCAKAALPNDPLFPSQWHLEQRDTNNISLGIDLNTRAAWPATKGGGVIIGFGDDGIETTHPDLLLRGAGTPHFNFSTGITNGSPTSSSDVHGTPLAGLAVAEMNNAKGGAGVAPQAKFASWKIFNGNSIAVDNEQLMNMFMYASNVVAVQNHSWGNNSTLQIPMSLESRLGVEQAVRAGRSGKGVVIVRSIPERRTVPGAGLYGDVNDDGYPSDPRVIAVAGLMPNGRHGSGSNPGAPILVGAGGGEFGTATVVTTDRVGTLGYNTSASPTGDYSMPNGYGRGGTSFAAPQIAGLAALMLSVNTNLHYRDVQQILAHSARHFAGDDSDLSTNGAGFVVSHNDGYGVPDAEIAVALASIWRSRPAMTTIAVPMDQTNSVTADDNGLRVLISGAPVAFDPIAAAPSTGLHPDSPTSILPLADVGNGSSITNDLTGKAALIQRGGGPFATTVKNAADAGAAFAIIYNSTNTTTPRSMTGLEYVPIPAVFIGRQEGEALADIVRTNSASAQLKAFSTNVTFSVTNKLSCEHVAVSVELACRRGDVRIVLTSPMGTKSILQRVNNDTNTVGLVVWTYTSTHHFHESSAGTWTLTITDEAPGQASTLHVATLTINGVVISDSDVDGMDDGWEVTQFSDLSKNPKDDEDGDHFSNIREYIMGTSPTAPCGKIVLSRNAFEFSTSGGSGTMNVGSLPDCGWTATSFNQWITLSGTNRCGPGPLTLTVATNTFGVKRRGTVMVGGYPVTVSQAGRFYPTSIAGMSFTMTVTNSSGPYSSSSTFMFVAKTATTYQIIPLQGGTNYITSRTGTFRYSANTGIITIGTTTIDLTFTDYSRGRFGGTNNTGTQNGTFVTLQPGPDFDRNGRLDLVFQNTNGVVASWLMNGSTYLSMVSLRNGAAAAPGWMVAGTYDFDADTHCDVLFQHSTGKLSVWLMNGMFLRRSQDLRNAFAYTGWKSFGLADSNYDNRRDILFQDSSRRLSVWYMNGTNFASSALLRHGQSATAGWQAFGALDFRGIRETHILFQHSDGKLSKWIMNNTTYVRSDWINGGVAAPAGWRAVGHCDLNSDGQEDIIFHTTSRVVAVWYMNGNNVIGSARLNGAQPTQPGWQLLGPR
jgi:subtilisin-like proprotein convertase family protein/subtilisin family serine protease